GANLAADVPAGVVPDEQQRPLAQPLQLGAAPGQVLGRDRARRAAVDEAQPGLLVPAAVGAGPAHQQAVAGEGLGIRIALGDRPLDQPQRLVRLGPGGQGRGRQAAPPDLVLEAEGPVRVVRRQADQADQAVAGAFLRAYAGSGLVIQRLARFQPMPSRLSGWRIGSSLTRSAVSPCSKLTSVARSRVQSEVGLPKVRGDWCSSARSRSAAGWSKADRIRGGRVEPGRRLAAPARLKAWIA